MLRFLAKVNGPMENKMAKVLFGMLKEMYVEVSRCVSEVYFSCKNVCECKLTGMPFLGPSNN